MKKDSVLKTKFKAVINVGGRVMNFRKSYSSPQRLLKEVKEDGVNMGNIIRVETFKVWE